MQREHQNESSAFPRHAITRRLFSGMLATTLVGGNASAFAQAAPKRGGLVKLGLAQQSSTDTFNSARFDKGQDYIRGTSVYSYLTKINQKGEAEPEVAESWESNQDATRWSFSIRKGIKFSDGAPLTTDDIIFSILRHKEEKVASSARQLISNITNVKADGPDRITVELAAPDVDLPILIGIFQFTLVKKGTYDFTSPVGTGAFTVKDFQPGMRTVLVRNPNYWKQGQPYIDQFEMFSIPDPLARANALLSGDVDMIIEMSGQGVELVAKSSNAELFVTPSTRYTGFQAAVDRAPSNNPDITLGLAHLVDRKRILETVLRGYGTLANDHPFGSNSPYYNSDLPQRALDLDKAKYHFKKSGIGNAPIEIAVSDAALYSVDMGQILHREATRAGLNMQVKREPSEGYWTSVTGKRPYFATGFHPRPTYNMLLNLAWKPGAVWNFSHYSNERLTSLIDQTRAEVDFNRRKAQYAEIQEIIHNSGALIVPVFTNYIDGVSKKIKGLTPLFIGSLGGFNFTDRIWIDG